MRMPAPSGEIGRLLSEWPSEAAAAAVGAAGVLDAAGPTDRVWPWASVTKLLTALAVLVAAEEGTLDLDGPAGPPGSTIRHLLAHASGLAPDGDAALAAPGTRRIYSNAGYEALGEALSRAAGMGFADYLRAAVVEPLGLTATTFDGSPASGARGPLADLARLAGELIAPTLVSPATWATATSVAFPRLDGVLPGYGVQRPNDWGLGPELRASKAPHWTGLGSSPATFGHFGRSGSFVWVDPDAGVALVELSAEPWGEWTRQRWPQLSDAVVERYRLRR